jgi:hypothetical protein
MDATLRNDHFANAASDEGEVKGAEFKRLRFKSFVNRFFDLSGFDLREFHDLSPLFVYLGNDHFANAATDKYELKVAEFKHLRFKSFVDRLFDLSGFDFREFHGISPLLSCLGDDHFTDSTTDKRKLEITQIAHFLFGNFLDRFSDNRYFLLGKFHFESP